ncbi:MAG: hypothetical protein ACE5SW_07940 [Nitrososphaeraceae archaeon]
MDLSFIKKVMKGCGLSRIPSRRTFDRQPATLFNDLFDDIKMRLLQCVNFLYAIK